MRLSDDKHVPTKEEGLRVDLSVVAHEILVCPCGVEQTWFDLQEKPNEAHNQNNIEREDYNKKYKQAKMSIKAKEYPFIVEYRDIDDGDWQVWSKHSNVSNARQVVSVLGNYPYYYEARIK
jgi:hypothetical protein